MRTLKARPRVLAARPSRRLAASRRPVDRRMSLTNLAAVFGVADLLPKNAGR